MHVSSFRHGFELPACNEEYGFCPKCPGNEAKRPATSENQRKSFKYHVRTSGHTNYGLGWQIWNCKGCGRDDFENERNFERHLCNQKKNTLRAPGIEPTKYTQKKPHKQIYMQAKKWSASIIYDVAFEEKWSLPGLYPAFQIPSNWRSKDWKCYGTVKPISLYETILKENNLQGKPDVVIIDKYIDIYDDDGTLLICLGPENTRPDTENSKLEVNDHGDSTYSVSFKNPSPRNHLSLSMPVLDEAGLVVYKSFKKGSGFTFHPHAWPAPAMRHFNPFVNPHVIPDDRFSKQVGMRTRDFWTLCDDLKRFGLRGRRNLPLEVMVSLYRTKMRQDINFCLLSTMYGAIAESVRSSNTILLTTTH